MKKFFVYIVLFALVFIVLPLSGLAIFAFVAATAIDAGKIYVPTFIYIAALSVIFAAIVAVNYFNHSVKAVNKYGGRENFIMVSAGIFILIFCIFCYIAFYIHAKSHLILPIPDIEQTNSSKSNTPVSANSANSGLPAPKNSKGENK